jgi:hypothetical protein
MANIEIPIQVNISGQELAKFYHPENYFWCTTHEKFTPRACASPECRQDPSKQPLPEVEEGGA